MTNLVPRSCSSVKSKFSTVLLPEKMIRFPLVILLASQQLLPVLFSANSQFSANLYFFSSYFLSNLQQQAWTKEMDKKTRTGKKAARTFDR